MRLLFELVRRNLKLYFKDKGLFFSSLITPLILLVLYSTFLANVYRDSLVSNLPEELNIDKKIINAIVSGQLVSSLLAVSCVTISFCSNLIMITDKSNKSICDLTVTPLKKSTLAFSYFIATAISSLIITLLTLVVSLIFLSTQGFYLTGLDIFKSVIDVILLTLFATSLSSCINYFLSSNGAAQVIGTLVSSIYGFICGAYMPLSSFGKGLQNILSFLPGTYGTSLIKSHLLNGPFDELVKIGIPQEFVDNLAKSVDVRYYFFDNLVSEGAKFGILTGSVLFFICLFIVFNIIDKKKIKR